MEKNKTIISEGNRPIWQIVIASLLFTLGFILCIMFFFGYDPFPEKNSVTKGDYGSLYLALLCFTQGFIFSVVKSILFDMGKLKYKEQYQIGPIKFGVWKELPKIEYVSVFRQLKADGNIIYEVNLWYDRNKHFNIYENTDQLPAFAMGEEVAKTLKVGLLDATIPNNNKWAALD